MLSGLGCTESRRPAGHEVSESSLAQKLPIDPAVTELTLKVEDFARQLSTLSQTVAANSKQVQDQQQELTALTGRTAERFAELRLGLEHVSHIQETHSKSVLELKADNDAVQVQGQPKNDATKNESAVHQPDTQHLERLSTLEYKMLEMSNQLGHESVSARFEKQRRWLEARLEAATQGIQNEDIPRTISSNKLAEVGKLNLSREDNVQHGSKESPRSGSEHGHEVHVHEFSGSIWDAALFIGTKPMGLLGSGIMLFLLLLNVAMQAMYTMIVMSEFIKPNFSEEDIIGYQQFRTRVAQDIKYVDPVSQASLAAKICAGKSDIEVAGPQIDALGAVIDYMNPDGPFAEYTGQVMCVLACLTWTLVVEREAISCAKLITAVLKRSHSAGIHARSIMVFKDERWDMAVIGIGRFVYMMIILLLRFTVSAFLLRSGLEYLVHTITLTDLVLNSVALECILSLDELIYEAFAPAQVHTLICSLEGLPFPDFCFFHGADVSSTAGLFCSAALLFFYLPTWISREVEQLQGTWNALCRGNKDFIKGESKFAPFYVWAETRDPMSAVEDKFAEDLTNAIIDGGPAEMIQLAMPSKQGSISTSAWSAGNVASWDVGKASTKWNSDCTNKFATFGQVLGYSMALTFRNVTPLATDCPDLNKYCEEDSARGAAARSICPQECGCDRPDSQLVLSAVAAGCPATCEGRQIWHDVLATANPTCTDRSLESLQADAKWLHYADMVPVIARDAPWPPFIYPELDHIQGMLRSYGCKALPSLKSQTPAEGRMISFDLCEENADRGFPYKSLRLFCPQTCNCTSTAPNCPKQCPERL